MKRWSGVLVGAFFVACNGLRDATPSPDAGVSTPDASAPAPFVEPDGGGVFILSDAGTDASGDPVPPPICDGGLCPPEQIASLPSPTSLAVTDTAIVFGNGTTLATCPKTGCGSNPNVLATSADTREILVLGGIVYWTDGSAKALLACGITGCNQQPTHIIDNQTNIHGLVSDGTNLYWTADSSLRSCPIANCTAGTTVPLLDHGVFNSHRLALGAGTVFWSDDNAGDGGFGAVLACPMTGCTTPTVIFPASGVDVSTDAQNLYFVPEGNYNVDACALAGCAQNPTAFATATGTGAPVSDGTDVYSRSGGSRYIVRCPIAGCPPEGVEVIVDTNGGNPLTRAPVAVDADYIYWGGELGIYRLKKR